MFYFLMNDGSHRPLNPGRRPPGVHKKVFLDAGEVPNKLWVKKEIKELVTKTVYVHPDLMAEFDHSPKAE